MTNRKSIKLIIQTVAMAIVVCCVFSSASYSQEADTLSESVSQQAQEQTEPTEAVADSVQVSEPAANEQEQPADSSTVTNSNDDAPTNIAEIRELISFSKVLYTLIILFITYYLNKYVTLILDNISERTTNYRLFIKRLSPVSRIIIWSVAIYIIIAGIIVPPFETILTIAASVGIAVGFASQDILRNIFGGIMIILDRPFQVGDKIQVGDHYGEVLSIGLRSSRMVTPDDSIVSIPNGELMNHAVSNSNSSALDCQVVAEIFLPATVDSAKVKKIAQKAVYSSSYSFLNKPVTIIVLNEMRDKKFVMKLRVKAYVLDIRYEFMFKSDVTEMILEECNKQNLIPGDVFDTKQQLAGS